MNKITLITRQRIADAIALEKIILGGRFDYADFLIRLYDLNNLPSTDRRYKTAYGDISCHSRFGDYEPGWMFTDSRFNLMRCSDADFICFLRETIHPSVCTDSEVLERLRQLYDKYLSNDGFESFVEDVISRMPIYSFREKELNLDLEEKKEKIKIYLNTEYVNAKIKTMVDAVHTNTDLALGTAKELIEITCKSILKEKSIDIDPDWDLSKLFKETIKGLSFIDLQEIDNPELAARSVKQLLSGCNTIIQGVAELRNAYGTGHGKEQDFKYFPPKYAEFVVGIVSNIVIFILQINGENTEIAE